MWVGLLMGGFVYGWGFGWRSHLPSCSGQNGGSRLKRMS